MLTDMNVGYSQKSLQEKLGIKEFQKIAIINAPPDYEKTLGQLPKEVIKVYKLQKDLDVIQFFIKEKKQLMENFQFLKTSLKQDGSLWICWLKQSPKIQTDINENTIREIGLKNGLVDVKVIAVDESWSGLKFVYRLQDRKM